MKRREPESEETDANASASASDPSQANVATQPTVNPIGNQQTLPSAPIVNPTQAQQEIKVRRIDSPVEATQTTPSANTVAPINPSQVAPVQATPPRPQQEPNSALRFPTPSLFLPNNASPSTNAPNTPSLTSPTPQTVASPPQAPVHTPTTLPPTNPTHSPSNPPRIVAQIIHPNQIQSNPAPTTTPNQPAFTPQAVFNPPVPSTPINVTAQTVPTPAPTTTTHTTPGGPTVILPVAPIKTEAAPVPPSSNTVAPITIVPVNTTSTPTVIPPVTRPAVPPTSTSPPPQIVHTSPTTVTVTITDSGNNNNAGGKQSQVKFENALDFLDQVKLQFQSQPKVYNQFLDIMKDFKAQAIDTPGVIARVSELFKGHRNLILGFNTFLPAGYKIVFVNENEAIATQVKEQPTPPPPTPTPVTPVNPPAASAPPSNAAAPNNAQRKQPEFDHARNYVKKIKMRFALQPHIYKAFLEILHNYHKEQHTIKDVYEQVANLFQHHQDLLEEFAQFLPDPTPNNNNNNNTAAQQKQKKPVRKGGKPEKEKEVYVETKVPKKETRASAAAAAAAAHPATPPREERIPSGSYEEVNFFYKVKQRLNNTQQYHDFLKCLNLFSQGIITRVELVLLVKDTIGKYKDLYDWFKNFIGFDDSQLEMLEKEKEEKEKPVPGATSHAEIDFKTCKRYGPSYRALPKNYIPPVCSGRNELCTSVLNDIWVSVPTGSEDYGFKSHRKNQYEEMLYKCEDDRFELDLVIELNSSTIRALERVQKALNELKEDEISKFKLDPMVDTLQIRSIERVYGDKGADIIEALYSNPNITVPVVLKRLKQKDQEWIKARREWNKIWREVNEKNYYKSLDHQSFFFKQNDKKNLAPKVLVAEIKQKYQEQLRLRERQKRKLNQNTQGKPEESSLSKMEIDSEKPQEKSEKSESTIDTPIPNYHLKFKLDDKELFQTVFHLVSISAEKTLARSDKEKIDTFFRHFVKVFFFVEDSDTDSNTTTTTSSDANNNNSEATSMDVDTDTSKSSTTTFVSSHKKKPSSSLFFGNNSFYVFFRLFEILYERLFKAKELSKNPQTNSQFAVLLNPNKDKKQLEQERDKFQLFLKHMNGFMLGAKEQSSFEDECRALFGVQAYILFTIDKLVSQLTKHLQILLSEEQCSKLLALYSYEWARPRGPTESVYHSNCVEILEDHRCFRFEFSKPAYGDFTIQLLDPVHNPPKFVEFSVDKHEKWSQYVENYTTSQSEDPTIDVKKNHVYLIRNRLKVKDGEAALEDIEVNNGLECRICLSTYRLFYVEDTEDSMYRRGALTKARNVVNRRTLEQRKQRANRVVDKLAQRVSSS